MATVVGVLGASGMVSTDALLPVAAGVLLISGGLAFFMLKK